VLAEDDEQIEVFTDDGSFSAEMIDFLQGHKA
jgi:hypothetical protein